MALCASGVGRAPCASKNVLRCTIDQHEKHCLHLFSNFCKFNEEVSGSTSIHYSSSSLLKRRKNQLLHSQINPLQTQPWPLWQYQHPHRVVPRAKSLNSLSRHRSNTVQVGLRQLVTLFMNSQRSGTLLISGWVIVGEPCKLNHERQRSVENVGDVKWQEWRLCWSTSLLVDIVALFTVITIENYGWIHSFRQR